MTDSNITGDANQLLDFERFALSEALREAIANAGYKTPTAVQAATLPLALERADLLAQAKTGSGKTAAFALPLLADLERHGELGQTHALVLCPTRELAEQVTAAVRTLAKRIPNVKVLALCGGVPAREQVPLLAHAPHVVIGTPGRVLDHVERQTLDLSQVRTLVLDEADRLLDMGFEESVGAIVDQTPPTRQTLLFSATIGKDVERLSRSYQRAPEAIRVDTASVTDTVEEGFFEVNPAEKDDAVATLLAHHRPEQALIFCVTKNDTRAVSDSLRKKGFAAIALHGDLAQHERDAVFAQFVNHSAQILVATDVAARGLDVTGLEMVISYELPTNVDIHIHRTGRTGRAGQRGRALHLVAHSEKRRADAIAQARKTALVWDRLPPAKEDFRAPKAAFVTLVVNGGRQDKLRPGDLLGALTNGTGLTGDDVGKIAVHPRRTYVAIRRAKASEALTALSTNKIKKRRFKVSSM